MLWDLMIWCLRKGLLNAAAAGFSLAMAIVSTHPLTVVLNLGAMVFNMYAVSKVVEHEAA